MTDEEIGQATFRECEMKVRPKRLSVFSVVLVPAAFVLGALAIGNPLSAQSATFVVNTTSDAGDASPNDGICSTSSGECSLRAAIETANRTPGANQLRRCGISGN